MIERAYEISLGKHLFRDGILSGNCEIEPFLLRPPEPHLQAIFKGLFLTGSHRLFRAPPDFHRRWVLGQPKNRYDQTVPVVS